MRQWIRIVGREELGKLMFDKFKAQQAKVGTFQAARNMRKQGIPLWIAHAVLL